MITALTNLCIVGLYAASAGLLLRNLAQQQQRPKVALLAPARCGRTSTPLANHSTGVYKRLPGFFALSHPVCHQLAGGHAAYAAQYSTAD